DRTLSPAESAILYNIRLPRLLLGGLVGAGLAVSGVLMQGLFRNPLADPSLVGVSAGAGLGAVAAIVLGSTLPTAIHALTGMYMAPVFAFFGGWITTLILYQLASLRGYTNVTTMLLAGIVLGALANALTGILIFVADDRQLRDLTFWGLGSLAGTNWVKLAAAAPILLLGLAGAPLLARGLNAMAMGEAAARHMGIPVEWVKRGAIFTVAAMTGAAVAVSGGIGFVGIVAPHVLRLAIGPDHRALIPASALFGAALLIAADTVARLIVAPAELPIGILMALIGAPVFLWLLLARRPGMGAQG
ncbi:MAG TPA: iron ABC transporter permease, partial [Paenirhodobacter sp.]